MIHKFVMELTDDVKGYEKEIEHLEREYGIEPIEEHDKQIRAEVIDEIIQIALGRYHQNISAYELEQLKGK